MRNPFKRSPKPAIQATQTEANFPAAPYGHHFEYAHSNGGEIFIQLASSRTGHGITTNTRPYKEKTLEARLAGAMQTLVDDHNTRAAVRRLAEAAIKKAKAAQ